MSSPNRRTFMTAVAAAGALPLLPAGIVRGGSDDVSDLHIDFTRLRVRDYKALSRELVDGGAMFRPTTSGYRGFAEIETANLQVDPPILVRPRSAREVSNVLGWCRERSIFPRIRSGGHSYGGYSTGTTLVLDLRAMNQVEPDGGDVFAIGAGASLRDVDCGLRVPWNRVLPAGTCPTVGISGLTMVGGHGPLTNRHGLTLDHLEAAEIVLADGNIVTCDEKNDADLFWAIRGGGSGSFGVVTRLHFRTHPLATSWRGVAVWSDRDFDRVLPAWDAWADALPSTAQAIVSLKLSSSSGKIVVVVEDQSDEPTVASHLAALIAATSAPPISGPSTSIPTPNDCDDAPVFRPVQARRKSALASGAFPPGLAETALEWWDVRRVDPVLMRPGSQTSMLTVRWAGALGEKAPDETAWVHRAARRSTQFITSWSDGADARIVGAANLHWLRDFYTDIRPHYDLGCYQGYWDPDLLDWPAQYYGENFDRLVTVKADYDPGNFFRFPRSIPTSR